MIAKVRPPVAAGTFYPADPAELGRTVDGYLAGAAGEAAVPKALICPHAGYVYSGPVAASGYATLCPLRESIRRVVLLGPSHRVAFEGLAGSTANAFATPLGNVPLDRDATEDVAELAYVSLRDDAHEPEHSLEVQLPFLQRTLGEFALVPLLAGRATTEQVADVLERFWTDENTLVVISSDLSHYHEYSIARALDRETSERIEALDVDWLRGERACGYIGIRGLLEVARRRGLRVETLDLRNSGDTAGPKDQVVGYGSYAVV